MIKIKKLSKKLSTLNSQLSTPEGFTLIELMVVLSITAVLGTLGIAGFVTYNHIQTLQSSANDLVTTLNLARSRALSQVKLGENCSLLSNTLDSYEVAITIPSPSSYSLKVNCHIGLSNFSDQIYSRNLPTGVIFKADPETKPTTFTFPVLAGGVGGAGQITLRAYEREKIIAINSLGGINIQLPILTPRPTRTPTPTPTITPTPPPATGGAIDTSGGYTIHTFRDIGTFTFTPNTNLTVEYLVVAGGGGGGTDSGGGGGAGGMLTGTLAVTPQDYTVIVGAGGLVHASGSNSVFGSTITSIGGGRGSGQPYTPENGGSGGGASGGFTGRTTGGTGTVGQGNNGGGSKVALPNYPGGGGGGAGAGGETPAVGGSDPGDGGVGLASLISGSSVFYAGGGGASGLGTPGSGGNGGGGNANVAGTPNTGGGGGAGGAGGSGIVIIRYR